MNALLGNSYISQGKKKNKSSFDKASGIGGLEASASLAPSGGPGEMFRGTVRVPGNSV